MLFKQTTKLLAVALATLTISTGTAHAQTAAVTADVTVLNTLTLVTALNLNFGTIAAVGDGGNVATMAIGTDGVLAVPVLAGAAVIAVVDNTAASQAQITIADGANGAIINVDIQSVVNPINGAESFILDTFFTSYNGGGDVARVAGVPWTETFDSVFGPNLNTLDIGATITTTGAIAYTDNVYNGGFDVVFSY